jgi:hypothetical protein
MIKRLFTYHSQYVNIGDIILKYNFNNNSFVGRNICSINIILKTLVFI